MHKNLELISTKGMDRKTWLSHRRIGGSDVSTLFGLNPYKPAIKLFHELIGSSPQFEEDNIATYSGRVMEDVIEKSWWRFWNPQVGTPEAMMENISANTPMRKSRRFNYIVFNPDYPWLNGNLDRIIQRSKFNKIQGILEIKNQLQFANKKWEGINPGYALQVQCYMLLTGLTWAEVAVLEDGRFLEVYRFDFNEEITQSIINITKEFWDTILMGREIWESDLTWDQKLQELSHIEPEPDGTEACESFLKERYRGDTQSNVMLGDSDLLETALTYLRSHNQIKEFELVKKKAGNLLRQTLINKSSYAIEFTDYGQVTWKTIKGGRTTLNVQSKILKKYEEYADR